MSYTCLTCSEKFDETSISKHLTATRHKSVRSEKQDETIECDECGDSNIHQLAISRYGLSYMSLLCQVCFDKERAEDDDKPSTQYTLSNGAFFSKLDSFYTYRDIDCDICQSDTNLFVQVNGKMILCKKCLAASGATGKFCSENDDDFLFALLGIKETTPGKKSTKTRGRKAGRFGGRQRKPKIVTPELEARRAHYKASKESASAIKSGTTVRAIGSTVPTSIKKVSLSKSFSDRESHKHTPKSSLNSSRRSTPTSSHNSSATPTPRASSPAMSSKAGGKSSNDKKSNDNNKSKDKSKKDPRSGTPPSSKSDDSLPKDRSTRFVKPETGKQSKRDYKRAGDLTQSKTDKPKGKTDKSNGKAEKTSGKAERPNGKSDVQISKNSGVKPGKEKKSKTNDQPLKESSRPTKDNKERSSKKTIQSTSAKEATRDGKRNETKNFNLKEKNNQTVVAENLTVDAGDNPSALPLEVSKFHPALNARLKFDNLPQYFREVSFNMFLEEQLTNDDNYLTSEDILIEWYADQDKKNIQYKLSMPLDDSITKRFISDKLKAVKKTPFSLGLSMFLILNDEIPWYGTVATLDTVKAGPHKKGRGRGRQGPPKDQILEMVVKLYDWNDHPLPKNANITQLKVLPASVPVSRVFNAMTRLSNESFKKMLLGNDPIKQIVFRNYLKFTKDTFNDSQKVAIQSVLNNAITVLQGPPGTGKTSTIFEIILQLLDSLNTYPILVVAASNIAIDNIAEKLKPKHEKNILRIVANEKEREYNRSHPLASICLHHKVYDGLPSRYQMVIDELKRGPPTIGATAFKKFQSDQFELTKTLVAQAKVIFTTTVVAGGNQLKSVVKCPVVIMDEATQSSEPTTLIPLSMPGVEKFVFVGDQRQLSCFSLIPSLSLSLFERVLLNETYKNPHMLDTQYRMHPAISEFPRNTFYGGLLKDGIGEVDRSLPGIPKDPVYFWDTNGRAPEQSVRNRFREDHGYTYTNRAEIEYVKQVLRVLIYDKNIDRSNIGIITPYSGQRDLISSTLVKDDLINPRGEQVQIEIDIDDIRNESKPVTIHLVSGIMIASIDAFQGREKDFLIMSCVRSNTEGKIGFLKDERRLNVALTRSKYGLVMIGDVDCLKRGDPLWKEYMKYLEKKKFIHNDSEFKY